MSHRCSSYQGSTVIVFLILVVPDTQRGWFVRPGLQLTIWDLADKRRSYCSRRSTMVKKKYAKKKKNVSSDLSNDNSRKDGITTLHGSTAGVGPPSGGIYTNGHNIHSVSPPGTGYQSPGTRQSSSPVTHHRAPVTIHKSPVTGHPGTGH